jgi:competence protein ComEC
VTDAAAIAMAVGAAAGALVAWHVPLAAAAAIAAVAFATRRPALLVIAVALLSTAMSARAWSGLTPPEPGPVTGVATLVTDPESVSGALHVELKIRGKHVDAWARGGAAGSLVARSAGERVRLAGRLQPVSHKMAGRLARRHIAARLVVERAGRWWSGPRPVRIANALRRTLIRGARPLPAAQRSLFAGFVLGDDREQPATVTDDFRASGLTHLLVVSGENVAFVLALASPLLRRVGLRSRLVLGLLVLFGFGLVTRWEPSVLRAEAMAAIALAATALGRPVSTRRVLALAVAGLLLVDPMLVRSVGFLLSVGACVGIATLAGPVASRLPGPRSVAAAIGVTVGAQVGVAPILVPVFGPLPVAALPANLLAVPLAGPIMVWGMTAGVLAGLVTPLAPLLHVPTALLLGVVALVAHSCARLPLGHLNLWQVLSVPVVVVLWRYRAALRSRGGVTHRRPEVRGGDPVPGDGDPQPHT